MRNTKTRTKIPAAETLDTTLKFDIVAKGKIAICNNTEYLYFDGVFSETPKKPRIATSSRNVHNLLSKIEIYDVRFKIKLKDHLGMR